MTHDSDVLLAHEVSWVKKKKKPENLIGTPKIRLRALLHLSTNMSSK